MNPIDEYMLVKDAAGESTWRDSLRNAAIQGGVALGAAALPIAASKVYGAVAKKGRFNTMMGQNEDLHALHEQDPKRFNQFFNSLHNMSPEYAADPIVAGSYMRQMLANPGGAGKVLVEARGSTRALPTSRLEDAAMKIGPELGKAVASGFKPTPSVDPRQRDIDDAKMQMEHQDTMIRAHKMGIL